MIAKVTQHPATAEQLEYRAKRFNLCACCGLPKATCLFRPFTESTVDERAIYDGSELEPECHRAGGGIGRHGNNYGHGEE